MKKLTRGFTLIELMIVVAIIGILAAIAIPNFVKYQLRSKFSEASSNIEGLRKAEEALRQGERKIMLDATTLNPNYKSGTYWNLAGSILPSVFGGTQKSNWAALELAQAGYMDWSVEGATYFQYQVAGIASCPVVGASESSICYFAGARADIDGDLANGEVALSKRDLANALPVPEAPAVVATPWPGTIGSCGAALASAVYGTPCTVTGPDVF